ncbi:MAG: hypothetical protein QNJ97_14060 [Myxococcota bacterium]|nr:hypothetical protein [Myxococcota bacterium]
MYRIDSHLIIFLAIAVGTALLAHVTIATAQASPEDSTLTTDEIGATSTPGEAAEQDGAQEQDSEKETVKQPHDQEGEADVQAAEPAEDPANDALIEQLKAEFQEKIDALTERLDQSELEAMEAQLSETESATRFIDMYGFFDINLFYYQIEKNKMPGGIFTDSVSFSISQLNLYFLSQMTETLSALIELRFSFLPQGHEKSLEMDLLGTEYDRIDTTVFDPFTTDEFQLGGVAIERVHLTYAPRDWFSVMVGHYLTPFGIWNVDHGSPVRLLVRHPYFMSREIIPLHQTGIQVFGRFIPMSHLYLDYAVTLSNGRGPAEAVYDLDNNKAVGLRLKGTYEHKETSLAIGGYAYYGKVTDVTKSLFYKQENGVEHLHIDVEKTDKHTELASAFDLVLKLFGFKLQFEYTGSIVRYDVRPPVVVPVLNIENVQGALQADHVKWGVYGLIAYEFVFGGQNSKMRLIPFFMVEYCKFADTLSESAPMIYRGGFNFKPSAFVTLKYELLRISFPESKFMNPLWIHSGQLAVSF